MGQLWSSVETNGCLVRRFEFEPFVHAYQRAVSASTAAMSCSILGLSLRGSGGMLVLLGDRSVVVLSGMSNSWRECWKPGADRPLNDGSFFHPIGDATAVCVWEQHVTPVMELVQAWQICTRSGAAVLSPHRTACETPLQLAGLIIRVVQIPQLGRRSVGAIGETIISLTLEKDLHTPPHTEIRVWRFGWVWISNKPSTTSLSGRNPSVQRVLDEFRNCVGVCANTVQEVS